MLPFYPNHNSPAASFAICPPPTPLLPWVVASMAITQQQQHIDCMSYTTFSFFFFFFFFYLRRLLSTPEAAKKKEEEEYFNLLYFNEAEKLLLQLR
jgi:hypothetical protein